MTIWEEYYKDINDEKRTNKRNIRGQNGNSFKQSSSCGSGNRMS